MNSMTGKTNRVDPDSRDKLKGITSCLAGLEKEARRQRLKTLAKAIKACADVGHMNEGEKMSEPITDLSAVRFNKERCQALDDIIAALGYLETQAARANFTEIEMFIGVAREAGFQKKEEIELSAPRRKTS